MEKKACPFSIPNPPSSAGLFNSDPLACASALIAEGKAVCVCSVPNQNFISKPGVQKHTLLHRLSLDEEIRKATTSSRIPLFTGPTGPKRPPPLTPRPTSASTQTVPVAEVPPLEQTSKHRSRRISTLPFPACQEEVATHALFSKRAVTSSDWTADPNKPGTYILRYFCTHDDGSRHFQELHLNLKRPDTFTFAGRNVQ